MKQWFVFYTKSRAEKKVEEELTHKGIKVYLPKNMEVRQWSDRKKKIQVPLFRSYIFIRCTEHEIPSLLQWTPNLVTYVKYNGKPAVIREEEIDAIERFLKTGLKVKAENETRLEPGDHIKIMGGPLEGIEGEVIHEKNNYLFIVHIQAIHQYIKIELPKDFIRKIKV